jgi:putative ABC transport system permease protein
MAFLLEIIRLGLHNLRLHKLRSFLTSLGIILGVSAVIIMVAIGEGRKQAALREIEKLGATNIIVRSTQPPEAADMGSESRSFISSYGILRIDLRRLQEALPDAGSITALKSVGDEMSYGPQRIVSQAFGVTPDLVDVANLRMAQGHYISDEDIAHRGQVAVIGDQVATQFFPLEDPIGKDFRIGQRVFRIIGVFAPVGLAGGAGSALVGRDLNKDVHIPLTTAELEFGDIVVRRTSGSFSGERVEISEIYITARSTDAVLNLADRITRILELEHDNLSDVEVIVPWELLEKAKRDTMVMNIMLIAIAAISLLVGGIGIMNIMLASVTERTREIGIRRALGGTRRDIVSQFLVETGTLSAVGGLVGIAIGVGVSLALEGLVTWITRSSPVSGYFDNAVSFPTQVTGWSVLVSFIVAASVGLVFGIYPAIVASRKDPVEALRHD